MAIFVIGINYKTAPIALREKVYFPLEKISLYLQDLLSQCNVREAVLMSTCNRSELYCETDDIKLVANWFCAQTLASDEIEPSIYHYQDAEAIAHIMEVACGLDSMVLGEPQILGQMKEAFSESCTAGAVEALFHRLFQQVFKMAKEIRTTTSIGACPVSVASTAVHFAKQISVNFSQSKIAVIGAGEMTELLFRYLLPQINQPIILLNRDREKALERFADISNEIFGLEQLDTALADVDLVFSLTGSALPLLTQDKMQKIMQSRANKPITLIDLAVPRDIEAAVGELPEVKLYCIDDLKSLIEKNRQGREHAAQKAREMIRIKSNDLIAEYHAHDRVTHTIRAYREQVEKMCAIELSKAQQQLQQGANPSQVLETFARAFTQKLLHVPSVQLRQAGVEGRLELLKFAKQLFAINDS